MVHPLAKSLLLLVPLKVALRKHSDKMWWSSSQLVRKVESLQAAESRLLSYAHQFGRRAPGDYTISTHDTPIGHSTVPLQAHTFDIHAHRLDAQEYVIHSIQVDSHTQDYESTTDTPLVMLHGYMNGGIYFYRNLVGLSRYFKSIHALDLLGWGLSSRPTYALANESLATVEDFYVESLEAWRKANGLDRMILAGHSMGGYFSVAYCERYPQHVERLILISPVGVPQGDPDVLQERENMIRSTWKGAFFWNIYHHSFTRYTPGDLIRSLPERTGKGFFSSYIDRRIPAIATQEEKTAVSDYLYWNTMLPGSGEYCLNRFLDHNVMARNPCVHRIPLLQVPTVSFLYGDTDWMDFTGGMMVAESTDAKRRRGEATPHVDLYKVRQAGHLLMLENWDEFNTAMALSAGLKPEARAPMPQLMAPNTGTVGRKETRMETSEEFRKNVKMAT
jgi:cardiolipin-specific phospholipase